MKKVLVIAIALLSVSTTFASSQTEKKVKLDDGKIAKYCIDKAFAERNKIIKDYYEAIMPDENSTPEVEVKRLEAVRAYYLMDSKGPRETLNQAEICVAKLNQEAIEAASEKDTANLQ